MVSIHPRRGLAVAVITVGLAVLPVAVQARTTVPTSDAIATMTAGDYLWSNAAIEASGVRIVVSLFDQKLFVYRGNRLIAVSAVSTGKEGHETPTGEFTILQKEVDHTSSIYDAAPMPFMQRLTWDGVAIHAGRDPGYAASHGCVRVPIAFAKRLYGITRLGARVTVTDESVELAMPVDGAGDDGGTDTSPVVTPVAYTR
ncbi:MULTISPECIES: L,D-transpeptidase family protein [unclassified Sphingomonas]|uniref:L,D-transpeptidase family protein n=1 Tax=unclassified Sphingomonas TaxID=196159 RepID=UPI001F582DA2|nr:MULTISPECIES: L,D-transpeptidase family protein [unclassified Sphingomonas]